MLLSRSVFLTGYGFFSPAPDPIKNMQAFNHLLLSICVLISLKSKLERTKRISLRICSFSSKVEPDLQTGSGSDQNVPATAGYGSLQFTVPTYSKEKWKFFTFFTFWPPIRGTFIFKLFLQYTTLFED